MTHPSEGRHYVLTPAPAWASWRWSWLGSVVLAGSNVWSTYTGLGRASAAVLLAALLCVPYVVRQSRRSRALVAAGFAVAVAPLPVILAYPFVT